MEVEKLLPGGLAAGAGEEVALAGASFRRVSALFAAVGFAESALIPFVPLLLVERGFSDSEIGVAFAIMALLGLVAGPTWAYFADRTIGNERALAVCCTLAIVASIGVFGTSGVAGTFLAMSALWVVRSPNTALIDAIALEWLQAERRALYGRIRLWQSAGWAAGALLWGGVLELTGLRPMTLVYAVLIGAVALYVPLALGPRRRRPRAQGRIELSGFVKVLPGLALFLLAVLLVSSAFNGSLTFATIRIAELGGGAFLVGLAGALQAATEVPVMAATPRLARRLRPAHVFALGCLVYISVFLVWALVPNAIAVATTRLVAGVGFGLLYVASVVIVDELVPTRLRATGQAVSKAAMWGIAPVLGSLGGGFVFAISPAALFVLSAVMAALAAVVAHAAEARSRVPR